LREFKEYEEFRGGARSKNPGFRRLATTMRQSRDSLSSRRSSLIIRVLVPRTLF
jgi:hypothetical protein